MYKKLSLIALGSLLASSPAFAAEQPNMPMPPSPEKMQAVQECANKKGFKPPAAPFITAEQQTTIDACFKESGATPFVRPTPEQMEKVTSCASKKGYEPPSPKNKKPFGPLTEDQRKIMSDCYKENGMNAPTPPTMEQMQSIQGCTSKKGVDFPPKPPQLSDSDKAILESCYKEIGITLPKPSSGPGPMGTNAPASTGASK